MECAAQASLARSTGAAEAELQFYGAAEAELPHSRMEK
jgi:hypothetical protein